jgi:hypothetical protein
MAAVGAGFWFVSTRLVWYVGASGVLHGVFACGCIALLRERDRIGLIAAVIFALKGACDPAGVERFRHHWISVGQIGRATRLFRSEGCRDLIFIGSLARPALSDIRLDWGTLRVMGSVVAAFRGGDDHLLSGIGRILEKDGFRMIGIKDAAPDLLMPKGCITNTIPDDAATADIARGRDVLAALGPFDIGQAAVVVGGTSTLGGSGTALGTLQGATLIGVLDQSLRRWPLISEFWRDAMLGILILLAVAGDRAIVDRLRTIWARSELQLGAGTSALPQEDNIHGS